VVQVPRPGGLEKAIFRVRITADRQLLLLTFIAIEE
jgi:hypothetical protein